MVILFNDLLIDTKPVKKNGVEMLKLKNSYHLVQLYPVKLPEDAKGNPWRHKAFNLNTRGQM